MKERVGFIGLGSMGVGMAANVCKAGYPLSVMGNTRREPVERLLGMGAAECSNAKDLASQSDVIILCVTTSEAVESLVYGDNGLLAGMESGNLVIDCGTSHPDSTLKISSDLQSKGCSLMDVPLGRSSAAAEDGTLNMMAGGSEQDFARAKPLLETMSENLFHLGAVGMGHKIKLLNNAFSMSVAALIAELVNTAKATDVDVKKLYDVMAASPLRSDFFDWNMEAALSGDESKLQFSLENGFKDIGYFVSMAEEQGLDSKVPAAARLLLEQVVERGNGKEFVPSLARLLRD